MYANTFILNFSKFKFIHPTVHLLSLLRCILCIKNLMCS